jgi:hypothetical protein
MDDYQISYRISKHATFALFALFCIFLTGVVIKVWTIWIQAGVFDIAFLIIFLTFLSFCFAAIWAFLIKKRPVLSISSKHVSIAVPYFFQIAPIPLTNIKEVNVSTWGRSEIVFQSGQDMRSLSFMAAFLSAEDRESFLSNIFDLLPDAQVK